MRITRVGRCSVLGRSLLAVLSRHAPSDGAQVARRRRAEAEPTRQRVDSRPLLYARGVHQRDGVQESASPGQRGWVPRGRAAQGAWADAATSTLQSRR